MSFQMEHANPPNVRLEGGGLGDGGGSEAILKDGSGPLKLHSEELCGSGIDRSDFSFALKKLGYARILAGRIC